ncbi:MAG: hypothetical protein LBP21_00475 [Synergistaceae bacterium]|nr:hypothetical protein [Synergistaceae bacterium]
MLKHYAKNIDVVICEGTALSRTSACPMSERELGRKAKEWMNGKPYVFVLCASTNIDRIGAFYHANPRGRLFVCDAYQKEMLELVRGEHAEKSNYYDFRYVFSYAQNLDTRIEEKGFCMLIRQGREFRPHLEKYFSGTYREKSLLIYSMWQGYLKSSTKNQALYDFLSPYPHSVLHTSGHASPENLERLYRTVDPKLGLIPIHGESPEDFTTLIPDGNIIILNDGESFEL